MYHASHQVLMQHLRQMHLAYFERHIRLSSKNNPRHYKHMRQEHPQYVRENWFHCSYCQSAFPDKWTLNAHLYHCYTLSPVSDDVDLDSTDFQLHWLPTKMIATKTISVSSFGIPDSLVDNKYT